MLLALLCEPCIQLGSILGVAGGVAVSALKCPSHSHTHHGGVAGGEAESALKCPSHSHTHHGGVAGGVGGGVAVSTLKCTAHPHTHQSVPQLNA